MYSANEKRFNFTGKDLLFNIIWRFGLSIANATKFIEAGATRLGAFSVI